MPGYRQVASCERDELRSKSKTMDLAPTELSAPDSRQVLRKRLCEEMEALRGILRKAELVVRKSVDKGRVASRRGKDGRFLAAEEARSEAMEADHTPCAKRRKAMPPVEIIKPLPRISKADHIPCAKKSRTTPPLEMEIIEPRVSQDEICSLVTRLSSLSSNIPARIVEFLHKECTGHGDEKAGEIEVDLGSMTRSAMFELQKLLDEFTEEEMRRQHKEESMNVCRSISGSSPRELEEGEFEGGEFIEEDYRATMDTCGGDTSVVARKGLCSPPRILEDGEMREEEGVICCDATLVATPETAKSPSNSSSSGSSSSSDGSSGSSCSDSSGSDSSESDSDDECVTSNVAPAVLPIPKADASAIAMPVKSLCSPLRILEDGEMTEEEVVDICGDASPIKIQKYVESAKSPSCSSSLSGSSSSGSSSSGSSSSDSSDSDSSNSGSNDECVTSNPASAVLPKTEASPMAMPHKVLSPIAEEELAETRNSRRSNSSLLEDGEIQEEQQSRGASPMAAKKFAETVYSAGSTNGQCVRSSPAPAVHPEPPKPQRASQSQGTVRHSCAKGFDKKRERAATVRQLYDKAFEKKRELERQRAYEKLEEMERNAKANLRLDTPGTLEAARDHQPGGVRCHL